LKSVPQIAFNSIKFKILICRLVSVAMGKLEYQTSDSGDYIL